MKIPEINHQEKSRQNAVPVQRCAKMAIFLRASVGKLYMPQDLALLLRETIERELPNLRTVTDEQAERVPRPGSWSPKEELGHLIDSAANNHLRFVLTSIDGEFYGRGY